MAGDWIPMRLDLADDPAVIQIAAELDLDDDHVVGKLHRLWSWASAQSRDGHACVTLASLNQRVNADGFAQAMIKVGWLAEENDGIQFTNWGNWMAQSAKARLLTARRQQKRRALHERDTSVTKALPQDRTAENRREEKKGNSNSSDLPASSLALEESAAVLAPATNARTNLLLRAGFDFRAAHKHAAEFTEDQIVAAVEKLGQRLKRQKVTNVHGYLLTLLRADGEAQP